MAVNGIDQRYGPGLLAVKIWRKQLKKQSLIAGNGLMEGAVPDEVEELKQETPRTREARLATERHNKLVAERERRLKKAEEKRKHFKLLGNDSDVS